MGAISIVHLFTHDETKPAGTRARSLGDDDIREFKSVVRERLAIDHTFYDDETGHADVGTHKKITFAEIQGSDPTAYTNVGYLYLKDVSAVVELFWEDESGNVLQLTSGGYFIGSKIRLENNTYLKAKDAAGTGTVDLIKASALDKPVLPDGSEMASDAAPTTDVQISNKKYVDDQIAAIPAQVGLGSWVSKSNNTAYEALTDGFVCGYGQALTVVNGYTDSSNPPTTLRITNWATTSVDSGLMMPVKKGDYWKVTGCSAVFWIPLG